MIYIVTLAILVVLIWVYDIKDRSRSLQKELIYYVIMWWFILVSGLAYNVGSDISNYMREFDGYLNYWKFHSFNDIFDISQRQPGWVLLNVACAGICSSFVFFKLCIAIFVNWSVFHFIKSNTRYLFTGVLLYAIFLYLNLNFNALRQSLAVAFVLLSYKQLKQNNIFYYYCYIICASLFHISAIICLVFPIVKYIKIDTSKVITYSIILLVGMLIVLRTDIIQQAITIFLSSGLDAGGADIVELGERYVDNTGDYGQGLNIIGVLVTCFNLMVIIFVILYSTRQEGISTLETQLCVIYLAFYVLNYAVPVVFYRFTYYLQIPYICVLANVIISVSRNIKPIRLPIAIMLIMLACYSPISTLLSENKTSGIPLIKQFAPYYSIFNPKIDPVRSLYFGYHE